MQVAEFDRLMGVLVGDAADDRRTIQVSHQPYPLANRLSPDLFIGPAVLRRPVGRIAIALGFNAYGKSAYHLSGAHAVERRPIVSLAIHDACGKWVSSREPLRLFLRQIISA